ncbi:hypothetical protein H8356DRAFT_1318457 [Neocallimastix lanati (nom. inval.)]|nr:hypothetical protein H8356DRAFT_1318457 [Neocallimastix sp. JGI-2020a]
MKINLLNVEDGSCELAKSGATPDKPEYYFNSEDSDTSWCIIKCYTTINEGKCTVSELGKEETFYDDNTGQLIVCDENGCKPKSTGASTDNGVFIDSSNPNQIIYCDGNKCYSKPSTADDDKPQYFINGDPDSDLIECRKNGEKITCKAINGNDGDVFLNGSYPEPDQNNQIIKCNSETCIATTISGVSVDSDENPQYS